MRLELIPTKTIIDPGEQVIFTSTAERAFEPRRFVIDGQQTTLDLIAPDQSPALVMYLHIGVLSQFTVEGIPVEFFAPDSEYGSDAPMFDRCGAGQEVSACIKNICDRPIVLRVWLEGDAFPVRG